MLCTESRLTGPLNYVDVFSGPVHTCNLQPVKLAKPVWK